ncbi:uncharacterized protein PF3D7_1120000-like [Pelobates fuscus]|uniref:uncharacterized protein PF3D7_1120000-like n=1 Tax=Pelobates fuscus TaxID=191477 RepID=UPI002FE490A6
MKPFVILMVAISAITAFIANAEENKVYRCCCNCGCCKCRSDVQKLFIDAELGNLHQSTETSAYTNMENKKNHETPAYTNVENQIKTETPAYTNVENQIKTKTCADTNVENQIKTETPADTNVENQIKTETPADTNVENQKKPETQFFINGGIPILDCLLCKARAC